MTDTDFDLELVEGGKPYTRQGHCQMAKYAEAWEAYNDFDPTTDDDQFRKRLPFLPDHATDREREIATKYTQISFVFVPDDSEELGYKPDTSHAWFTVGVQSFRITSEPCDDRDHASWCCWMFAKAIEAILDQEPRCAPSNQDESAKDAAHVIIKVAAELVQLPEIPHPDDKRPTRGEVRTMMANNCKRANRLKKAVDALRTEN